MKIYLDTIGCRLNQAEIEQYARQFRLAGHTLVASPEQADLAVVNTCAVTSAAVSDSRQKIRQLERHGVRQIAVTGCWSTLNPAEAAAIAGVCRVIPNLEKDRLVPGLLQISLPEFDPQSASCPPVGEPLVDRLPVDRSRIPGARARTRAFIKVQDGCDNRCTFCVTTLARGPGRSRPIPDILADIHLAADAQEIVLTGVHLGSWGQDLSPASHLYHLVETILKETALPRLRLSSLEPWDLQAGFFELWQDPRLCRHLHLPLQSGCAATLRRMARKTTPESFAGLVAAARLAIPDVAITTDIITGFPGESEAEFQESLAFVRQMRFAGGHVFTYSARPGTAAAPLPDQVPHLLRKERNARLRLLFAEASQAYRSAFIGQVLPVLWESAVGSSVEGWEMSGLTGNYLRVHARSSRSLWNQITPVRLSAMTSEGLFGQVQI
jgi:threonylcarbamoyladenosine tRNA methylthiotransferase MtaB